MNETKNVTEKDNNIDANVQENNKVEVVKQDSNTEKNKDGEASNVVSISGTNHDDSNASDEKNQEEPPKDDEMKLVLLDKDFVYECMAVPTYSKKEFRMVTFIILWARRNGIKYEFDDFGNVYLTKGTLEDGEFYPCVTSHLDTVQDKQEPYIYAGVPLDLKTSVTKEGYHKISVDSNGGSQIGIGADDKSGICICLSMFKYVSKLKACFFLDEETGCNGSDNLDLEWFKDVGYVIGYDSPDLYRAAWSCSGVKLFSYDFYLKHMKKVCDRWGLTSGCFFSEPYTDVKNIREKTDIICMNFGNGGYYAHSASEYVIIEDMDQACCMGIDLINSIGCTEHKLKHTKGSWTSFKRNSDGTYEDVNYNDTEMLKSLGDDNRKTSYGYSSNTKTTTNSTTVTKEDELKFETLKYVVNRYDSYLLGIKEDILEGIKSLCEKSNVEFAEFESVISEKFNNEIKF